MQTSETFAKVVSFALAILMIVASVLFVLAALGSIAKAQNAGTVGIQTKEITVFVNQASATSSAIFPDYGFGSNVLSFCGANFSGTIDLEWSPTGSPPFLVLAKASYSLDNGCHFLPVGAYFPNMRSTISGTLFGSVSAWYTASSAPVSFVAAAIGSNGPTSPIVCDQTYISASIANGATAPLAAPQHTGDILVVCGLTLTFGGATAAGSINLPWATSASCASTFGNAWYGLTTASTPQFLPVSLPARSPVTTNQQLCLTNNSGAALVITLSWASIQTL